MKHLATGLALCLASVAPAKAQPPGDLATAEILHGWQDKDGQRMAAIRITVAPGWKTYWRAPGDAGIPPQIDWSGSGNVGSVAITWPTPEVFDQNGMRSIGYSDEVVLPIRIDPRKDGKPIRVKAVMDIGVCKDICVPERIKVTARIQDGAGDRDPRIAAAIASRPLSAKEAGVSKASCTISPSRDGLDVTARLHVPSAGGKEIAVIETDNPKIWVADAATRRDGGVLVAKSTLMHVDGESFMVNRSGLRFTILGSNHAVDIQGCSAG